MLHSSGWSGTAVGASASVGEEHAVILQTEMQKQCRREQVKESYDRNRLHFSFSWTQSVKTWQGGSASWQGACTALRFAKVTGTSCCQVATVCQNSTMVVWYSPPQPSTRCSVGSEVPRAAGNFRHGDSRHAASFFFRVGCVRCVAMCLVCRS